MRRRIEIFTDLSRDIDPTEIAEYIINALRGWGGGGRPEDPLFTGLDVMEVKIMGQTFLPAERGRIK